MTWVKVTKTPNYLFSSLLCHDVTSFCFCCGKPPLCVYTRRLWDRQRGIYTQTNRLHHSSPLSLRLLPPNLQSESCLTGLIPARLGSGASRVRGDLPKLSVLLICVTLSLLRLWCDSFIWALVLIRFQGQGSSPGGWRWREVWWWDVWESEEGYLSTFKLTSALVCTQVRTCKLQRVDFLCVFAWCGCEI